MKPTQIPGLNMLETDQSSHVTVPSNSNLYYQGCHEIKDTLTVKNIRKYQTRPNV